MAQHRHRVIPQLVGLQQNDVHRRAAAPPPLGHGDEALQQGRILEAVGAAHAAVHVHAPGGGGGDRLGHVGGGLAAGQQQRSRNSPARLAGAQAAGGISG